VVDAGAEENGEAPSGVSEFRHLGCNSEILLAEVPNPEQF
jgi:hypothetical protein